MGYLVYDSSTRVLFEDRVLAHLEVVIVNKLRRRESFAMSYRESADNGGGRSTLWFDASLPLRFRFEGGRAPSIDRDWVELLAASAASSRGLIVTDENGDQIAGTSQERPAFTSA